MLMLMRVELSRTETANTRAIAKAGKFGTIERHCESKMANRRILRKAENIAEVQAKNFDSKLLHLHLKFEFTFAIGFWIP